MVTISHLTVLEDRRTCDHRPKCGDEIIFLGTWYGEPVYFTLGDKWWDPMQDEVFAHSNKDLFYREHLWRQHSEYAAPKFYDKWIPESIGKYFW
ncbi:hypothetical protein Y032_0289g1508 [Ancylostoma ceylanicum]|uniref:NADH dehydrogenase [ubiquinone] 1 alpha subcomplex subunit 13 n=1 Tax=Ancylostoma ceylanicum TaxID=53326 RepID=A0A016S5D6_9BILA|nr:hypothetical protein Y032_0289g1508 [Ancylostoma ceylanicum]